MHESAENFGDDSWVMTASRQRWARSSLRRLKTDLLYGNKTPKMGAARLQCVQSRAPAGLLRINEWRGPTTRFWVDERALPMHAAELPWRKV
jgi:hypothetical protein